MEQNFNYYYHFTSEFGGPLLSGGPGACPICPVGNQSLKQTPGRYSIMIGSDEGGKRVSLDIKQWFHIYCLPNK